MSSLRTSRLLTGHSARYGQLALSAKKQQHKN